MKQSSTHPPISRLITSGLTILAALLQTAAMFFDYEPTNYFRPGAWHPTVALVCALLAGVIETISVLSLKPIQLTGTIFYHRNRFNPSVTGFLLAGILLIFAKETFFRRAAIVFLLLSALYALLCGLPRARKYNNLLTVLGFAPVLACALINAYYYFDLSVEMNTPAKICLQSALILIMLCFTGELRFLQNRAMPRTYLLLHGWARALGALCAVSLPIAFLCNRFYRVDYAAGALLIFSIVLTQHLQARRLRWENSRTEEAPVLTQINSDTEGSDRESEDTE